MNDSCLIEVRRDPFLMQWNWRVSWTKTGHAHNRIEYGHAINRDAAILAAQRFASTLYLYDGWEIV